MARRRRRRTLTARISARLAGQGALPFGRELPNSSQPRSPADAAPAPADTGKPAAAAAVPAETTPTPAETTRGAPTEPAAAPAAAPPPPVDPPAVEPPPVAAAAPPTATAALGPITKSRLRRLFTVGGTLAGPVHPLGDLHLLRRLHRRCLCALRSGRRGAGSDGPIIALYVVDNQTVKKGDKLFTIDPVPFQLEVNQRQAQIEEQTALLKVAQEQLATAKAALAPPTSAIPMPSSSRRGTPFWRRATTRRAPSSTASTTNCAAPRRR